MSFCEGPFSAFVRARAVRVGYDIDSPRGGGKKALAERSGMSHASVSRMLSGKAVPAAESLEGLAQALDVHVGILFELASIVSPGALTRTPVTDPTPITARQAADLLGIRNPLHIELLEAVIGVLRAKDGAA